MKKNLRIVSAAAAALLTVAPVATSLVSTVSADVVNGGSDTSANTPSATPTAITTSLTVTNKPVATDTAESVKYTLSSSLGNFKNGKDKDGKDLSVKNDIHVYRQNDAGAWTVVDAKEKLGAGNFRVALSAEDSAVTPLSGLSNAKSYSVNGGQAMSADVNGTIQAPVNASSVFTVNDPNAQGAPYVVNKATKGMVTEGAVTLDTNTVANIKQKIDETFEYKIQGNAKLNKAVNDQSLTDSINKALSDAKVTVNKDGSFDAPVAPVKVPVTVTANNGKTATFTVTVNPAPASADSYGPAIFYNGVKDPVDGTMKESDVSPDAKWDYVALNGTVDKNALAADFKAEMQRGNDKTGKDAVAPDHTSIPVSFDTSKVNTKVAGQYTVVATATNPMGKTATVTIPIHVGAKGATYKKVEAGDGATVPVYNIEGNSVSAVKDLTVKSGDVIAVFGNPVKVNGKSYSKINSADSNQYVESQYVDGSYVPEATSSKKVMHAAYVYDKDGKRVGTDKLASYSSVSVSGDVKTIANGVKAYKLAGKDNQYVKASNIDGTKMTLKHNAYVYSTSKKHTKPSLKKGSVVTVYGGSFTFKNGKKYYRIGENKQYVKVANF